MKQHITKKQWNELEAKQKISIIEKIPSVLKNIELTVDSINISYNYVALTIGQMIEFLGDDKFNTIMIDLQLDYILEGKKIGVRICDALWEATKEKSKD